MENNFKKKASQIDSLEAMKFQIKLGEMNPTIRKLALSLKGQPLQVILYTILKLAFDSAYFKEDNPNIQTVRDAMRLLHDKQANCVDYSVFIGTFLSILKIPYILRMVSFEKYGDWSHVYVVVYDGTTLDAILGQDMDGKEYLIRSDKQPIFNNEVPYIYKYDVTP